MIRKSYYLYIKFYNALGEVTENKVTYVGGAGIEGAFLKLNELLKTVYSIPDERLIDIKVSVGVSVVED